MRVIAGSLGGQSFASPHGHTTHPMSEKIRGAIFAALGDIEGLHVLDTFAGTGALGIEAISRGAASVIAVDNDRQAAACIRDNARALGVTDKLKVVQAGIASWSATNQDTMFDLVFVDPPYDKTGKQSLVTPLQHLAAGGLLVLSWPGHEELPELRGVTTVRTKNYGDSQLAFYRKIS